MCCKILLFSSFRLIKLGSVGFQTSLGHVQYAREESRHRPLRADTIEPGRHRGDTRPARPGSRHSTIQIDSNSHPSFLVRRRPERGAFLCLHRNKNLTIFLVLSFFIILPNIWRPFWTVITRKIIDFPISGSEWPDIRCPRSAQIFLIYP